MNRILIILIAVPALVLCADQCTDRNDGVYEVSCRSYLTCDNGEPTIHECFRNSTYYMVFNTKTNRCDDAHNVQPPCGIEAKCNPKETYRHADLNLGCRSFYTCVGGQFDGHNFCPASLVFDESQQICNWDYATPPPCGTAPPRVTNKFTTPIVN